MINSPIGRNDAAEKVVIEDIFAEMAKYGDDVLENNERVADLFLNGSSLTEEEKLTQMY